LALVPPVSGSTDLGNTSTGNDQLPTPLPAAQCLQDATWAITEAFATHYQLSAAEVGQLNALLAGANASLCRHELDNMEIEYEGAKGVTFHIKPFPDQGKAVRDELINRVHSTLPDKKSAVNALADSILMRGATEWAGFGRQASEYKIQPQSSQGSYIIQRRTIAGEDSPNYAAGSTVMMEELHFAEIPTRYSHLLQSSESGN
jgi:hypothetical protein